MDVARQLGMAVRSVQLMVDRGDLDAWRTPGGHRRISRSSVDRWLQRQRGGEARIEAPAPAAEVPPAAPQRTAAPPRVLLIEDSKHFQNLMAIVLRSEFPGLDLRIADDGIAGLAMAGELQPDVLIVDILLPGIDGPTLIMSLRSHPQFAKSRLIVVTSLDESERAPYRFALEGVPIVHKPYLVKELPQRVAECLAHRAAA
jgi:excisionase family DNA binding protein